MSGFLKFKRRFNTIRIIRSVMIGLSVGLVAGGVWLVLWKLAVIDFAPLSSLYIGLGGLLISGGIAFLAGGKSDKRFAKELDLTFGLKARIQTMVEYAGEGGELVDIQRQDADEALSRIPLKNYKFKRLWIYILVLILAAVIPVVGVLLDDVRNYVPPEEIVPFELSALQETGINNLIKYVETSQMSEEFRQPLVDELRLMLETLRNTDTQEDMLATVNSAMAKICEITYASSTATELLNALWDSGDVYLKHLAQTLDSSEWNEPDWGDFSEKITDYEGVLMGDTPEGSVPSDSPVGKDGLRFAIDTMSRKLNAVLDSSGVAEDDEIRAAVNNLFNSEADGLVTLLKGLDGLDDDGAREGLGVCLDCHSPHLFDAVSLNKINANVGEYTMIRLSGLFIIPLPEFERPEFVKNGESVGSGKGDGDDNLNTDSDGGIGKGETFGGTDLVLDPMTGELVEYGKLLAKYNAIMYDKLDGDFYTEEEKKVIRKYFDLLYSGLEEKEGN